MFTLNNKTYLGVKMYSTGNLKTHQQHTKEKAIHAFYKLTQTVEFKRLKPKQANNLFDSLLSPILTYACEVWRVYSKQEFNSWDKDPTDKVHLKFCKYYLGVKVPPKRNYFFQFWVTVDIQNMKWTMISAKKSFFCAFFEPKSRKTCCRSRLTRREPGSSFYTWKSRDLTSQDGHKTARRTYRT